MTSKVEFIGPRLEGQVCVQQSVDILPVDNTDFPTEGSKMVEVPRGLKQRWKPFGWSEHSTLTNHEYIQVRESSQVHKYASLATFQAIH